MPAINLYAGADRAIQEINRQFLRYFGKLKLAKWDELNVIRDVGTVYQDVRTFTRRKCYEVAVDAYITALYEMGIDPKTATGWADRDIDIDWILAMLEEVNPTTLYSYDAEADRKKQRLIEAVSAAQDRIAEIDKACRYMAQQSGFYVDYSVFAARLEAFAAAGVEKVRWVTERDPRVCGKCDKLDGRVFAIENVPPPQHPRCRCHLEPVTD